MPSGDTVDGKDDHVLAFAIDHFHHIGGGVVSNLDDGCARSDRIATISTDRQQMISVVVSPNRLMNQLPPQIGSSSLNEYLQTKAWRRWRPEQLRSSQGE
jgi:hypothetical protein